ncbi:hypothetical protein ACJIZ3_003689 [Penstemon smallii]|uniref:Uncharacterized protein n=1 Tax=Penstemon smallii TaxID=265156 RepID=A0ABD3UBY1_9LAMI
MKFLSAAIVFFIILTASSGLNETLSIWIPEHRCIEKNDLGKCYSNKCMQKCSGKPLGHGRCIRNYCICSYYCQEPPK